MKRIIVVLLAGTLSNWMFHAAAQTEVATGVVLLGHIENPAIIESSGIVPARGRPGTFWTHNDSGADTLFGITAEGAAAASLAGLLADDARGSGPALVILTGSNVAGS